MDGATADRRLFVGLALPWEIAERLERQVAAVLVEDGRLPRGIRTYPARDLHLTLCFLGAQPAGRVELLGQVLQEELRGLPAPELALAGTGAFPDVRRPRVLWAGVEEERESAGRLMAIHNRVRQASLSLGWRPPRAERDRPFHAHVTLARVRAGPIEGGEGGEAGEGRAAGRAPAVHPAFARLSLSARWLPTEVTLFESRRGAPGERYHALRTVPLVVRPG